MKKKVLAFLLISISLSFNLTSPSQAGQVVSPNVTELGLILAENAEIGRSPSTLAAMVDPEKTVTWRVCKDTEDAICTSTENISGIDNLAVCQPDSELDCIASIWAVDQAGNKILGTHSKAVPQNSKYTFKENVAMNLPRSDGLGSIWTIPGVKNASGSDSYFVGVQESLGMKKASGTPISQSRFSGGNFLAAIFSIDEVPGTFRATEPIDSASGGVSYGATGTQYAPDKSVCASTESNLCYAIRKFPDNYRFGMTLRMANPTNSWFHGRFFQPNVTLTRWKTGTEITIEAAPVNVPSLDFVVPNSQIPEAAKKLVFTGREIGMVGNGIGTTKLDAYLGSQEAMDFVTAFAPAYNDKATRTNSYWSFRPLNDNPGNIGDCLGKVQGVSGLVTTNALSYSAGPPQFDNNTKTLNYKVASPHYEADGAVAEGTYDLAIKSEVARCIYKFTNAPIKAEVSVLATDGTKKVATTVVNERDGWLYLSAKGFTFSSPTIQVALSQDAPVAVATPSPTPTPVVTASATPTPTPSPISSASAKPIVKLKTITCIKGKLIKKVTAENPKCPVGYKVK